MIGNSDWRRAEQRVPDRDEVIPALTRWEAIRALQGCSAVKLGVDLNVIIDRLVLAERKS